MINNPISWTNKFNKHLKTNMYLQNYKMILEYRKSLNGLHTYCTFKKFEGIKNNKCIKN